MDGIEFRFLEAGDEAVLERVADDLFDNAIDPVQAKAFLEDPRHFLFVAIEAGVVVGFVSALEYLHPDKQPQMFINEIGTAPSHRRRGIGRRMLDAMVDVARGRVHSYAWLGTETDNKPAQALFGRASDPDDNPQTFLLYEWDLDEEREEAG